LHEVGIVCGRGCVDVTADHGGTKGKKQFNSCETDT
jgi:hypothetical protein